MAISKVKYLHNENGIDMLSDGKHHEMVKTIYTFLTDDQNCPDVGAHWQKIGFQQNDPKTDIRGGGMLSILHVLDFQCQYPLTLKFLYTHSQIQNYQFPLIIKLFSFSAMCLTQLRSGELFGICNEKNSVFKGVGTAYCCLVVAFAKKYVEGKCNIVDMNAIEK